MKLRDMPNFGPKSQDMLEKAGFDCVKQLQALGSVRSFVAVKRAGCKPSLNFLWAIEGLLSNRSWRDVARDDRLSLLMQLEVVESRGDGTSIDNYPDPSQA